MNAFGPGFCGVPVLIAERKRGDMEREIVRRASGCKSKIKVKPGMRLTYLKGHNLHGPGIRDDNKNQ